MDLSLLLIPPFQVVFQPFSRIFPLFEKIAAHPAGIECIVLHRNGAVRQNDRDPRIFCLLKHRIPPCLHNRVQDNVIHFLQNKIADCFHLIFLLLLPVLKDQVITVLLRESLSVGFCICKPPVRLGTHLGKSHHDQVFALLCGIHVGKGILLPAAAAPKEK